MFQPSRACTIFQRGTGVHFVVAAFEGDQSSTECLPELGSKIK
jgi:hypothetical protein